MAKGKRRKPSGGASPRKAPGRATKRVAPPVQSADARAATRPGLGEIRSRIDAIDASLH